MSDKNRISATTKLFGLIGSPVSHSFSPKMHNAAFEKLGLDCVYMAFDVTLDTIPKAVEAIRTLDFGGANVTMPCKAAVMKHMDELTTAAQMASSVNTIINRDGRLIGHVTDGEGYMRSLREEGVDIAGKKMTIAGGGGAASAIIVQAALDGVKEIAVFNRRDEFYPRVEAFTEKVGGETGCSIRVYDLADSNCLREEMQGSAVFANCTGVGMEPMQDMSVVEDVSMFHRGLIVTDVIYHPDKTKLLRLAESAGCKTINGLGMVLYQGAASFKCWTGKEMPIGHVKKVLFG